MVNKIATEYAEAKCPVEKYYGEENNDTRKSDMSYHKDSAMDVLQWLCKNYAIVPKDKVVKEYDKYATNLKQLSDAGYGNSDPDVVLCEGVTSSLATIFDESSFKIIE